MSYYNGTEHCEACGLEVEARYSNSLYQGGKGQVYYCDECYKQQVCDTRIEAEVKK